MWLKILITAPLFYLLAVLQSSFVVPNLVFALFFVVIFFSAHSGPAIGRENLLYSVIAGFLLDVFSYSYFGVSIVLLLLTGILVKKIIQSLREKKDKYPIAYFVPLFLFFNIFYDVFSGLFLFFFDPSHIVFSLNWLLVLRTLYSLVAAVSGFYIYKGLIRKL